jgi:hypothetical protein
MALVCAGLAHAHVVSMSSSELLVTGQKGQLELHMPMYEISHVTNPETALLDHIRFDDGTRVKSQCHEDSGTYVCQAEYAFSRPLPDKVEVECTLFQVTVPNHVHLLHATQGPNGDQVVFDQNFTKVEARFHPPSAAELIVKGSIAGLGRLFTSVGGLLFLVALALAGRTAREAILLGLVFIVGEWLALPLAPRVPLALSQGFLESAIALTVAYLAVDVLMVPEGRARWAIVPLLGIVHGMAYAAFPAPYLSAASAAQLLAVAALAMVVRKIPADVPRWGNIALLVASLGWFARLLVR